MYSVSEINIPAGWDLVSATCDDGSDPSAIDLNPGETVVCVFVNEETGIPLGTIIVGKQTTPAGATESFEFSTNYSANFFLSDGEASLSGPLSPGIYSVSEINIPTNWVLTSATCDDGSDPSTISLGDGETVFCVFVNTQTPIDITAKVDVGMLDEDAEVAIAAGGAPSAGAQAAPGMELIKTATPDQVDEPGDLVTYAFTVNNLSPTAPLTVGSLTDSVYGDLNGQGTCALPHTIPAGGSYTCQVTTLVSGNPGDQVTNVATAETSPSSDSDAATVAAQAPGEVPGDVPPVVPEASTLLLLGSAASGLAAYIGLQVRSRRRR
jgi:hypothetical protein